MEEERKVTCPCCGQETLKVPVSIPEHLKDTYVACMLTGEPYKQRYELYEGKLNITVQDLSKQDVDELTQLNIKAQLLPEAQRDIMQQIIGRCYRMLPIISIDIQINDQEKVFAVRDQVHTLLNTIRMQMTKEELTALYNTFSNTNLFSNVPEAVLDRVVTKHILQSRALVQSGFDDSFYQGIGHVS